MKNLTRGACDTHWRLRLATFAVVYCGRDERFRSNRYAELLRVGIAENNYPSRLALFPRRIRLINLSMREFDVLRS